MQGVRPTAIQKMCPPEGMHPNNASTRCTGEKMLKHQFFPSKNGGGVWYLMQFFYFYLVKINFLDSKNLTKIVSYILPRFY